MNILVICHYGLYSNFKNSFVHNQIKEYVNKGCNVKVIIPIAFGKKGYSSKRFDKMYDNFVVDKVDIHTVRYLSLSTYGVRGFNHNSAIRRIKKYSSKIFDDFIPDIIHSHCLGFESEIGVYYKNKFKVPMVVTTHGTDCAVPIENGELDRIKSYMDKANRVVAVSSVLKSKIDTCNSATKTEFILNGFNTHYVRKSKKIPLTFMQVSNLIKQKKVDVTIKAFSKIHTNYPSSRLSIVGSGSEREYLERLTSELGLSDSVEFCGFIENDKVLELMAETQFFIMPSVREGFGIVYLEAMASRCVTVGTKGEGIADLIVNGKNGILVDADNIEQIVSNINKCIEDEVYIDTLIINAKNSVDELSWEYNAIKYLELFKEAINENKFNSEFTD